MSQGELVTEPTAKTIISVHVQCAATCNQLQMREDACFCAPTYLTTSTAQKQPGADALQRTPLPSSKGHVSAAEMPTHTSGRGAEYT